MTIDARIQRTICAAVVNEPLRPGRVTGSYTKWPIRPPTEPEERGPSRNKYYVYKMTQPLKYTPEGTRGPEAPKKIIYSIYKMANIRPQTEGIREGEGEMWFEFRYAPFDEGRRPMDSLSFDNSPFDLWV